MKGFIKYIIQKFTAHITNYNEIMRVRENPTYIRKYIYGTILILETLSGINYLTDIPNLSRYIRKGNIYHAPIVL